MSKAVFPINQQESTFVDKVIENPFYELCYFVGNYSQYICGASFNEDEVRHIWSSGKLNNRAEHPCYEVDSVWPDAPLDFQAEMNRLVRAAAVWPSGWREKPKFLSREESKFVGLPEGCHGSVMCCLIRDHAGGSGYNEQLIIEFFYEHWEKFQLSGKEFIAQEFFVELEKHPDFLELRRKFEVVRKPDPSFKHSKVCRTPLTVEFKEAYSQDLHRLFHDWVKTAKK